MDKEASKHAKALSELGAAKGGRARAKALTPEERREIARYAAEKRWGKSASDVPKATHSGLLPIGEIPCAVLDDGTRVLSERGVTKALGGKRGGAHWRRMRKSEDGAHLPVYLSANNLRPFIDMELAVALSCPIVYRPVGGGAVAYGVKAELLPKICDVLLKARDADVLLASQKKIAAAADVLMRGLAHVGIIALVDEATGYQAERTRDALARILERFIAKELRKWVKTFPADFYQEMYRLRGWKYADDSLARPQAVGNYTNDIVYKRLAPGVLEELRRLTPRDDKGRLKNHFHRRLTEDVGHPKLREHLASVVTIMKLSQAWDSFMKKLDRIHPRWDRTLPIPFPEAHEA